MTAMHLLTDEQLGNEIGLLIRERVESTSPPAGVFLAIQDRLGSQDSRWSVADHIEKLKAYGVWLSPKFRLTARVAAGVIAVAVTISVLIWQGRDSDQGMQPAGVPIGDVGPGNVVATVTMTGGPAFTDLTGRFDFSGMDAAETEAEILRLLDEGYVMYTLKESFVRGGIFSNEIGCAAGFIPQRVCEGYPESVIEETWESTDSSGSVDAYYGRMKAPGGIVLATGVQGEWTDVASGENWSANESEGRELVRDVGTVFEVIRRKTVNGLDGTESEFAGRPSLKFSVADQYRDRPNVSFTGRESEYQVDNPFFRHEIEWLGEVFWLDRENENREINSESTVLDFAMLPPGLFPRFALLPPLLELDVPNLNEGFDLSDMDLADTTAELGRLFSDGHVRYIRMELFNLGGAVALSCRGDNSRPHFVCDSYPGRIVQETWESTDSRGVIAASYGRESKLDGTVLAIGIQGEWIDIASGETWSTDIREGRKLTTGVEAASTTIERVFEQNENVVEGEILGRPSVVIPEGVFEYQLANPAIMRQTRWQDRDDGTRYMISEGKVIVFAMLPPGSLPEFAAPGASELDTAERALLAARDAAQEVSSYSVRFVTGFSEKSLGTAFGFEEFYRLGRIVIRNRGGDLVSLITGNYAYSQNADSEWCQRELEREQRYPLLDVPESLDRITRVERLEDGNLLIEGFAADYEKLVNDEYPSINLHRIVIDSTGGHVVEWKWWGMFSQPEDGLLERSTDELIVTGYSRKTGPWDKVEFSDFDELEPLVFEAKGSVCP